MTEDNRSPLDYLSDLFFETINPQINKLRLLQQLSCSDGAFSNVFIAAEHRAGLGLAEILGEVADALENFQDELSDKKPEPKPEA